MVAAGIIGVLFIVITNSDSFLYYKEYILKNHLREPLSEGQDHCWLLWAQSKGDKLSGKQMCESERTENFNRKLI